MVPSLVDLILFKPPLSKGYHIPSHIFSLETSRGNTISATYLRRKGANVTILFSHGNAEDLNSAYYWMRKLSRNLDVNVMGYDYTGYGDNQSDPSEKNCYADIEAAYNYLLEVRRLNPEQIVLYGRSVGSGPSCYLAAKTAAQGRSAAGLILHSPFSSVYRVIVDVGVTMIGDKFSNIDRISKVECPVFIVHGEDDNIIPVAHGKRLYAALPEKCKAKPFFLKEMNHNDHGYQVEDALMERLNHYLDYHILTRRVWMKRTSKPLPQASNPYRQVVLL